MHTLNETGLAQPLNHPKPKKRAINPLTLKGGLKTWNPKKGANNPKKGAKSPTTPKIYITANPRVISWGTKHFMIKWQ